MTAFVIFQAEILDPERYDDYIARARESILAVGGRFIARDGAVEALEGEKPLGPTVILEFPTKQAAVDWYHGPDYRQARTIREGAARVRMFVVEGVT